MKTSKYAFKLILLPIYIYVSYLYMKKINWNVLEILNLNILSAILLLTSYFAYTRKKLTCSACITLLVFALFVDAASNAYIIVFLGSLLLVLFVSKNKFNKFQDAQEARNATQLFCNIGFAMILVTLQLCIIGSKRNQTVTANNLKIYPILNAAILANLSSAMGDTFASELTYFNKEPPNLILYPFKKVPRGTNGGVTMIGFFCSLVGGTSVGIIYYLGVLVAPNEYEKLFKPNACKAIVMCGMTGILGSLFDSILGASLQYSGFCLKKNEIVDEPAANVKWISGLPILDNESVNFLANFLAGTIIAIYVKMFWSNSDLKL